MFLTLILEETKKRDKPGINIGGVGWRYNGQEEPFSSTGPPHPFLYIMSPPPSLTALCLIWYFLQKHILKMPTYTDWKVISYKFIDYETNILGATFGQGLRLNLVIEICKINVMFIMRLRWSKLIKLSNCKCKQLLKLQHICEDQMLLFLIFIS